MSSEQEVTVELGLDGSEDDAAIRAAVAKKLRRSVADLPEIEVRKRSIDARRGRVRIVLVVGFASADSADLGAPHPREVAAGRRVIVIGDGPAGLFCAYELARHGIASVVLDRGQKVRPRRRDLKALNQRGHVDPNSNYCFGEGGAGTYSDGKLYTRSHKRGDVRDIIEIFALHGAPRQILIDARPHIGSNRLPKVITAMRERLEQVGVEFRFGARVVDLDVDGTRAVRGAVLDDGETIGGDAVVLATGHSARDVLDMLTRNGVDLEAKAFALGVRIEHPQAQINKIQYGRFAGHPKLPAASYRLAHNIDGRGIFSFCMCPGGWIVPASTEVDGLVVNGMSLSRRDSPYANSGLVVGIEPSDLGNRGPLTGIEFQRTIEQAAFTAGGGQLRAPATRVADFIAKRGSSTVGECSYVPGITASDISEVLDCGGLTLSSKLRDALRVFGKRMKGYDSAEAHLIGVESRTSSPVRVPRSRDSLQSPDLANLYPCGEGAGYAGGIVSAAVDGVRVARAIIGLE